MFLDTLGSIPPPAPRPPPAPPTHQQVFYTPTNAIKAIFLDLYGIPSAGVTTGSV